MARYIFGLIIASCLVAFSTQDTPFFACSNNARLPSKVQINDCSSLPCVAEIGSTARIQVDFIAPSDSTSLKVVGVGKAGTKEKQYFIDDPCAKLTEGSCPLKKNEKYQFTLDYPVLDDGIVNDINIELHLHDSDSNELNCFTLPVSKYNATKQHDINRPSSLEHW